MCFLCRLSFTNPKPFLSHCQTDHALAISDAERDLFRSRRSSAILQCVDKTPLLSLLEPMPENTGPPRPITPPVIDLASSREEKGPFPANLANLLDSLRMNLPPSAAGLPPDPAAFLSVMSGLAAGAVAGPTPTNASQLQGTTIGPCPDHVNGRQPGIECEKCDFILNSFRGSDQAAWANQQRGVFKTLKCPKCNWHYKYQETLEVHMKDKHPEAENSCIYCVTGQQHPRLARGETYTCGYKPYRCEVCNYSTTTKGNLSIHMQSDKHINNMQELQSNGGEAPSCPSPTQSVKYVTPTTTPKPVDMDKEKPSWRCDICNYETNIARNLRIHMTSEKHMNNVMNLQGMPNPLEGGALPPLPDLPDVPSSGHGLQQLLGMPRMPGGIGGSPMKEAQMADMAFNQALLMQMMGGAPGMPGMPPMPFLPAPDGHDQAEMDQTDPNPRFLYNCAVCREFSCDHLQALSDHLAVDRTKLRESEVSLLIGGTYICKLCSYKTNLKANFQLHCKTDKHLQKLQLVNHIMEGGPTNEWTLNFMNVSNSVQLRCNACDFYTDSIHKLQTHSANQGHEVSTAIFSHLRKTETETGTGQVGEKLNYSCTLCSHTAVGKTMLLQHCRSVKHLQMEQLHLLQRRAEGANGHPEIGDIFTVTLAEEEPMDVSEKGQLKLANSNLFPSIFH